MKYNVGIYQLRNIKTNSTYIGKSRNLRNRKNAHFFRLKNNISSNKYMQKDYNVDGKDIFIFEVILYCEKFELKRYEQLIIDLYQPIYNIYVENSTNRQGTRGHKTKYSISQYFGVSFDKRSNKWTSQIRQDGKLYWIGIFNNEIDAAIAYDKKEIELFNDKAILNFDYEFSKNYILDIKQKGSCYRGVSFCKRDNLYGAEIKKDKKRYYLGNYKNEIDAALAYDKKAIELYGENAKLNFALN
jgi:group I intron endonuclease